IIQSSHPSSLKFTCRAFLLQRSLDFLPCRLPWRLAKAVRRRRRPGEGSQTASEEPSCSRISENRFLRWDLVNTTSRARSWGGRTLRPKPRLRRSGGSGCSGPDARSWASTVSGSPHAARSSKHSCFQGWWRRPCHTSNTSQPVRGAPCGSRVRASSSRGDRQGKSCTWSGPVGGPQGDAGAWRKSRSSAPTSSSLSESVDTSNKYFCLLRAVCGPGSSWASPGPDHPGSPPRSCTVNGGVPGQASNSSSARDSQGGSWWLLERRPWSFSPGACK
uniref:Uncharacterized protein n=1 Tax=Rhinolophus ferrumequinum TaxID=59479 RepID=A0A671F9P1_RHIFE